MKQKTFNKLLSYSGVVGMALTTSNANATLQITDVNPDSIIYLGDRYNIDLDGDLNFDVDIRLEYTAGIN